MRLSALVAVLSCAASGYTADVAVGPRGDAHAVERPLHAAALRGDAAAVAALLRGAPGLALSRDAEDATALHSAARAGSGRVAALLLDAGAAIDARDAVGCTPLHHAAHEDRAAVARLLVARGASPLAAQAQGATPLHLAAVVGADDVARVLVAAAGAAELVGARDTNRETPLHLAARGGQAGVVAALLGAGASVAARGADGSTPLHAAAEGDHVEIARLLAVAAARRRRGESNAALTARSSGAAPAHLAASVAVLGALLDGAADAQRTRFGDTALHHAAWAGRGAVAAALLDRGADPDAASGDGSTPLGLARRKGHDAVARLLAARGAARAVAFPPERAAAGGPPPPPKDGTVAVARRWVEAAMALAPLERRAVVLGDYAGLDAGELLFESIGASDLDVYRAADEALRAAEVFSEPGALDAASCAALRDAVDAATAAGAQGMDTVDGQPEQ
ncbi:ankyrin repeat-containing domain protein [Pelagophyceae sp. CCMP2097]|nr:ankyrin repeat-containing domain protein [Pelagophyceae sp. CCMP2097]